MEKFGLIALAVAAAGLALSWGGSAAMSAVVSFFRAGALWMSLTGRFSEADYHD